jgi:hypothetical protein
MAALYRLFLAGCISIGSSHAFCQSNLELQSNAIRSNGAVYIRYYSKDSLTLNTRLLAVIPHLNQKNSRIFSPLINPLSLSVSQAQLPSGSSLSFSNVVYEQWKKDSGGALAQEFLRQVRDQPVYIFPMMQAAPRVRIKF